MAKNRRGQISRRRLGHMVLERNAVIQERNHLLLLQRKLKDGTADVINNPDGTTTIITVPYKEIKLK